MSLCLILKVLFSIFAGFVMGIVFKYCKISLALFVVVGGWVLALSVLWFCNWWLPGVKMGIIVATSLFIAGFIFAAYQLRKGRYFRAFFGGGTS